MQSLNFLTCIVLVISKLPSCNNIAVISPQRFQNVLNSIVLPIKVPSVFNCVVFQDIIVSCLYH